MNAKEFVKKHSWDCAKNIVDGWIYRDFANSYHISKGIYCNLPFDATSDDCGALCLFDLKTLVDAYELVQRSGGMKACKRSIKLMDEINADKNGCLYLMLEKAVKLVESVDES